MMARFNYDTANVHVIYNGVDLNNIKPRSLLISKKQCCFSLTKSTDKKASIILFNFRKILSQSFQMSDFCGLVKMSCVADTFETHGYVREKQELEEIYQSSYLLLLPIFVARTNELLSYSSYGSWKTSCCVRHWGK